MKKIEKMLENKISRLIGLLSEQDPPPNTAGQQVTPAQPQQQQAQPQQAQQPQQQAQPQQPQQQAQQRTNRKAIDPGTKIQYLSTINLYTSPTPPDSADWREEAKTKKQFMPLTNAKVVNELKKYFPALKATGARAAKYSDYQFRIILSGSMNADAEIKISTEEDKSFASLEKIKINTFGTSKTGRTEIINSMRESKKIPLDVDLADIRNWTKTQPKILKKEKVVEPKSKPSETAKESEPIKSSSHPYYGDFVSVLRNQGYKAKEAKSFVEDFLQNKKVPTSGLSDKEKAKMILQAVDEKKRKEEKNKSKIESLSISSYIRSLMLEKTGEELETGKGGDMLKSLNHNLDKWFSPGGIAASTDNRIFRDNIYEWFAVKDANFTLAKRKVEAINKKEVEVTMEGQFKMEVEVWVDARIGENNGNLNSWTFRVLDGGKEKVLGQPQTMVSQEEKKLADKATSNVKEKASQTATQVGGQASKASGQVKNQATQSAANAKRNFI